MIQTEQRKYHHIGLEEAEAFRFNDYGPNGAIFAGWRWGIISAVILFVIPVTAYFVCSATLKVMLFIVFSALLGGLGLYLQWRYWFFGLGWKTDSQGLTTRGFIVSRRIEWKQVKEFSVESYVLGHTCYVLKTENGVFRIPQMQTIPGLRLTASIWQHLPDFHSERVSLPLDVSRLYKDIPGNIPTEIGWTSPSQRWVWVLAPVSLIAVSPILYYILCYTYHPLSSLIPWGCMFLDIALREFMKNCETVKSIRIESDGFKAITNKGTISLKWSEIGFVDIDISGNFEIGADSKHRFALKPEYWKSRELQFALARYLRENNSSQIIPVPVN